MTKLSAKESKLPQHIAIIMDGNGRWAKQRHLPRSAGHRAGFETAKKVVRLCAERGIRALTLFAFSSENWKRPAGETSDLMGLVFKALQNDIKELHENNIQFRIAGDYAGLSEKLQKGILEAEKLTQNNTGLKLVIAFNYGGRWDVTQAARRLSQAVALGQIKPEDIDEATLSGYLSTHGLPDPDLFIRAGGDQRISNFLLWQLAYTELYFTEIFWPEFNAEHLEKALNFFASRERRFGALGESFYA
jgi:undecaprenyl diphosphate synthase